MKREGERGSTAPRSSSEVRRREGMKSRLDTGRLCAFLLICLCLSELGGVLAEQLQGKCRAWTHNPGLRSQPGQNSVLFNNKAWSVSFLALCRLERVCMWGGGESTEVCQLQEAHEIDFERMQTTANNTQDFTRNKCGAV